MSLSPLNYNTTPGQKVVTQNTGVKRILGVNLAAQGKVPGWLYYLIDIQSYVVYANDGNEVWLNCFGQPAAGSLAYRDSISPFEGYRFYVVEQDISYEWKGGSWEGTAYQGHNLSPTYLIRDADAQLTLGRKHLIVGSVNVSLPVQNVKEGHEIIFCADTICDEEGNPSVTLLTVAGGAQFRYNNRECTTEVAMVRGVTHVAVFDGTGWQIFLADVEDLIDNIGIDRGLLKTGSAFTKDLVFFVDFVEPDEEIDLTEDSRALSPASARNVVSEAERASEYVNITGLLPHPSDPKLNFQPGPGNTSVVYDNFRMVWNEEPYIRTETLGVDYFEAGSIAVPVTTENTTFFIIAEKGGTIRLQTSPLSPDAVTEAFLGLFVANNGTLQIGIEGSLVVTRPWLSSSSYTVRHRRTVEGGIYSASATAGKVQRSSTVISAESNNWANSTVKPHTLEFPVQDPALWTYLTRDGDLVGPFNGSNVVGNVLDDTTPVAATEYTIQVVYIGGTGLVGTLLGQQVYADLDAAEAALASYTPIIPNVLVGTLELSRWIVKGDQFPGSGTLDLTDPDNFKVQNTGTSGGAGAGTANDIATSVDNSTLDDVNLQLNLDELSSRTSPTFRTGGGALGISESAYIDDSSTYKLPAIPAKGKVVRVCARNGVTPLIEVNDTGTEVIKRANQFSVSDISFIILSTDSGIWYEFISNGTEWEI